MLSALTPSGSLGVTWSRIASRRFPGAQVAREPRVAPPGRFDWDHYNSHAYFGIPNLNQFRFQVGILGDLLGRRDDDFTVEGRVSVGASTIAR